MQPMIQARTLAKRFGEVVAVRNISVSVMPGSVYALLGPNGAGKSTTINMLTTLLKPDQGSITINGHDVERESDLVRRVIGVTFQDLVLDRDLTGREALDFAGRLYNIEASKRRARITDLVEMVGLGDAIDRMTGTYSGGMRRRLELARCLMMEPKVLFLDEPTQGLDPQHRALIWDYIRMLKTQQGMTVLLTTHGMDEAEALADVVGIIDHGKMMHEGTPSALIGQLGSDLIRLSGTFTHLHTPEWTSEQWVTSWQASETEIRIGVDIGARRITQVIEFVNQSGNTIEEVSITRPSLGDVFLQATGRALRDER
ncbi:MAG: ATP-binding cassette domain-containing protein [Chloroflexi bacterium]|nr:ATP-binding cassette domain-containing protein [Chloroflexota bacterium]